MKSHLSKPIDSLTNPFPCLLIFFIDSISDLWCTCVKSLNDRLCSDCPRSPTVFRECFICTVLGETLDLVINLRSKVVALKIQQTILFIEVTGRFGGCNELWHRDSIWSDGETLQEEPRAFFMGRDESSRARLGECDGIVRRPFRNKREF